MAPVDRRAERALARGQVAWAAGEEGQALPEAREQRLRREQLHSRGGELDRKRKPVEAAADLRDRVAPAVQLEARHRGRCALGEERERRLLLERRKRVLLLARQAKRLAARRQHLQAGRRRQLLGDARSRVQKVLEVVENEEADLVALAERGRNRRADELGVGQRREVDEGGAVRELAGDEGGDLDREAGLPHSARAGDGQQAAVVAPEQTDERRHLELAPDERCRGRRQVDGGPARRLELGVLAQDLALELLELRARLEAELLEERAAGVLVGGERVCLPAGAVEREHQLRAQALAVGLLGDEPLQLGDELLVAATGEVALDPLLERRETKLLEPLGLLRGERLVAQVSERAPAPERERLLRPRPREQALEALEVELVWLDAQPVARAPPLDAVLAERAPQAGDVPWSAFRAVAGGSSPQRPSISRSSGTTSFACRQSSASSARCFGGPSASGSPFRSASSGPRTRNSVVDTPS